MNTIFFNLSKNKKRDVLYELLTDSQAEGIISTKELNAINKLIGDTVRSTTPPEKQTGNTKRKNISRKKQGTKRKTTHYLTEDVFENLAMAKKEIQSLVPENSRKSISKTKIVNRALALILEEFETKGENSRLVRHLVKKN